MPATAAERTRIAVQVERDNIALYDRLIPTIMADVLTLFERVRTLSHERLRPAFEHWAGG